MKARKLLAFFVAGVMGLSLALTGCGGTAPTEPTEGSPTAGVKYLILDEVIDLEQYGVGFRMEDTTLRDIVEFTIVEMYNDGTVQGIAAKYADLGISYDAFILTATDVKERPTWDRDMLYVGFDQNFPPYGFVDNNGDFAGFDLDMAAEVAARNGWEITLVPINWDFKDAELAAGNIDCIWNGFTITEDRKKEYLFTKPYMDNSQVMVVLADSGISTLADLDGKVVMAQAASAAYEVLTSDHAELVSSFKELRTIPDYNSAFLELNQGSVDAIAIDLPVAVFQMAANS
ncbi:MAG: transporter substrate-binding domain-containing protein [Coriobacteriia bacterium]|nr:transporter substrate-binding domain-containing protein [Coriobacteriia bacterium]